MKKIVIATMLAMLFVTMVATTVFAKWQPENPKAYENACWGQVIRTWGGTSGEMGDIAKDAAKNGYGHGASTEVQEFRCGENCGQCTPKCD